jgi:hypothetical protein
MTRDPNGNAYDDAAIEQLVRDVADSWTMPPVRLDTPSWRDRVRSPGARRLAAAGGWLGRFGQAATAAVALTVVGALIAVLLTHPQTEPGKTPGPSTNATSGPTRGAQATPLSRIQLNGDEPYPDVVVVRSERGDYARVDLKTGSIDGPLTGKSSSSALRLQDDGSMVCLCVSESGSSGGMSTDDAVTLERYDARGKLTSTSPIESFSGKPDPRDEGRLVPDRPAHVLTSIGFSADGRYGFVGWSVRAHPVWQSGILVVDLRDGSIVSRFSLPDATDGQGEARRVVAAPGIVGSISSSRVAIARGWYEFSPATSQQPSYTFENDVFTAKLADGTFSDLAPVQLASDCGATVDRAGALPDGGFWLACRGGGSALTVVRRLAADGSLLDDIRVSGGLGVDFDPTALSADGSTLYLWDPAGAILTAVDLAKGTKTSGKGVASVGEGPLSALGHWLAPTAAAKSLLRGALAISPDGSRIYAIGVKEGGSSREVGGSAGVFVFDAATLAPAGVWQPIADYVSVAVSADGRFVYAAGLPGTDAAGQSQLEQQASITVYDTTDGSVRLIAGRLGGDMLSFISPALR